MKFINPILFILLCTTTCFAQKNIYPTEVEAILVKSGNNRPELEKVISHCKRSKDSQKLQAAYFLIENMDIHHSVDYYWKDGKGKKVNFSEFDYPDFASSVAAMDSIRRQREDIYMQDTIYEDIKTLKGAYLISNIENAFDEWRKGAAKAIPFETFCEYILPYRTTVEPVQDWRFEYSKRYKWIGDSLQTKSIESVLRYAGIDYKMWFKFVYGEERNEPLIRLGARQILFRQKGACEEAAALQVFALRSQGIPISYDVVPLWGTSTGRHFLNGVFFPGVDPVRFDVTAQGVVNQSLAREPAKVIRVTYSKQPGTLAAFEPLERIPDGFMQMVNYLDVTSEYWETSDISFDLFSGTKNGSIVYACMINGGKWQPVWWGKAENGLVNFTNMPKGTAILPAYCLNGNLIPAGFPKVNGYNNEVLLKPDTLNTRTITMYEQEKYLKFRPGKSYALYYWDSHWVAGGEQVAMDTSTQLTFINIPTNVLLKLIPEYSQGKERPFIITADDRRYWW